MKPYYWIGILAVAGSFVGTIIGFIFPDISIIGASTGTIIGVATGTSIYASSLENSKKDD